MSAPGIAARLLELLQQANNLQLFQLNSAIELAGQTESMAVGTPRVNIESGTVNEFTITPG